MREHGAEALLLRARAFTAAQRELQEAERKAKAARAKQQGEEAEAEPSEADQAATEETGRGEKEGSTERFVRRRTAKEELEESAPPAAGETSAAAAEEVQQVRKKGKPTPLAGTSWRDQRGSGGCSRAAKQASRLQLQDTETHQFDPQMLPREFSHSASNTGWLHHQGSRDDSGTNPLRYPD